MYSILTVLSLGLISLVSAEENFGKGFPYNYQGFPYNYRFGDEYKLKGLKAGNKYGIPAGGKFGVPVGYQGQQAPPGHPQAYTHPGAGAGYGQPPYGGYAPQGYAPQKPHVPHQPHGHQAYAPPQNYQQPKKFYPAKDAVYKGKYAYIGNYRGACHDDGFYFNDKNSIVICSNGNAYRQPCAPGTRNSGKYATGKYYTQADFCNVNLNDLGYGGKH